MLQKSQNYYNTKIIENYMRMLAFLYVYKLEQYYELVRDNNTVDNFWMLFATLSAYAVVASEVVPEVGREALAHVACEKISLESAIVASSLFYHEK